MLDDFLLVLFDKYAELLKKRFSEDFQEVRTASPPCSAPTNFLSPSDCFNRRLHANGNQLPSRVREGCQRELVRPRQTSGGTYVRWLQPSTPVMC